MVRCISLLTFTYCHVLLRLVCVGRILYAAPLTCSEYFEHTVEAIFCGEICLVVFRGLSCLPIQPIWVIAEPQLSSTSPVDVITGASIGLLGAGVAASFSFLHFKVMDLFGHCGLLENSRAVYRAMIGGSIVVLLGMVR